MVAFSGFFPYIYSMLVTIEVINKGTLSLLREMENLGLIHVRPSVSQSIASTSPDDKRSNRWLKGCCKNLPEGSVDEFLARCRADKERELAIEKRQEEERSHRA